MGPLGQGLLGPSGITVEGQLKQGLVSIAPPRSPLTDRQKPGQIHQLVAHSRNIYNLTRYYGPKDSNLKRGVAGL